MAAGSGGAGKGVAGCSGCLVVAFLALTIFFTLGGAWLMQVSDGRVSPSELQPLQILSSSCCCLSGVGVIIGIVLLLLGGNKSAPS